MDESKENKEDFLEANKGRKISEVMSELHNKDIYLESYINGLHKRIGSLENELGANVLFLRLLAVATFFGFCLFSCVR